MNVRTWAEGDICACGAYGEVYKVFLGGGNSMEKDHFENLGVNGRITQDRQYTYNVTFWRVCLTTVAVDMQQCIHYFINGKIVGKNVVEDKICVLIFSTNFVQNICQSNKNSARCYHKCT
jgi:hypothetical protein